MENKKSGATNQREKRMPADEDKRLGEFMDAFVSRSGSANEERKAAEAISVSTVVMPVESV